MSIGTLLVPSKVRKQFGRTSIFEPLTKLLLEINDLGIPEDKIPVKYRPWKKWDLHFPSLVTALEYKSITSKSIEKCKYLRVEEHWVLRLI